MRPRRPPVRATFTMALAAAPPRPPREASSRATRRRSPTDSISAWADSNSVVRSISTYPAAPPWVPTPPAGAAAPGAGGRAPRVAAGRGGAPAASRPWGAAAARPRRRPNDARRGRDQEHRHRRRPQQLLGNGPERPRRARPDRASRARAPHCPGISPRCWIAAATGPGPARGDDDLDRGALGWQLSPAVAWSAAVVGGSTPS